MDRQTDKQTGCNAASYNENLLLIILLTVFHSVLGLYLTNIFYSDALLFLATCSSQNLKRLTAYNQCCI